MVETHVPTLTSDQDPHIQSLLAYPTSTPHLNRFDLTIKDPGGGRGRGVYATSCIPGGTLIEVSPVLLFPPAEYALHGSKTQLDGYTFVWKRTSDGAAVMALALGLGSLFNHHPGSPNVKWMLDHATHSIRYTTTRRIEEGEELTISYGTGRMWWEPKMTEEEVMREQEEKRLLQDPEHEALQMGRIGLSDDEDEYVDEVAEEDASDKQQQTKVTNGIELQSPPGPSRPNSANYPPIYRLTAALDPVTLPLETRDAWIIDIPPTSASLAVKFLQKHPSVLQNRDDGLHSTRHLRSFRTTTSIAADGKKAVRTQFLLCLQSAFPDRTSLVDWLKKESNGVFGDSPEPYLGKVPVIAAPTKDRLAEWQAVWPCIVRTNPKELIPGGGGGPVLLVDRRKDEQMWSGEAERLRWACNRFKRIVALARHALAASQVGEEGMRKAIASAVHVTHPFEVARKFVPFQTETAMSWTDRESRCDWSSLTGPSAPVVGRIAPLPSFETDIVKHWESEKARLLTTLSMTETEWSTFNSTPTQPIYTTPNTNAGTIEIDALDQRLLRRNPLKHAPIEAVSRVSVLRTLDRTLTPTATETQAIANGSDYLLTNLSLFTLYEPCVYCTMALLHSRVSEIYFLLPSPGRGGCCGSQLPAGTRCDDAGKDGGMYALQEQKGLNHSFTVWRWMRDSLTEKDEAEGDRVDKLTREFDIGLLDP
ncbi:uncharacterized protein UTRI_00855_B [Ustilago trichophora]|uniref:SET domain-containing protein n=1 Tax=Ustilago trichophora TaxID=86804 RepID=A0A5C3DQ63_9BASI|nr:uncharacterized protein UTRI_00855_B [Ustilago trichophora]